MKIFLGYYIWCRSDMLAYLLDGIVENFDPDTTELGFVFDQPLDGVDEAFKHMHDFWLQYRGFKFKPCAPGFVADRPFKYTTFIPEREVREVGGHNILLRHFMEHTDCDVMVAPQDDIRFNRPIHAELKALVEKYGPSLGVVGSRDGYSNFGYADMASSFWSRSSPPPKLLLQHGEYAERTMMNSGPISYPRHVVERAGYLDEDFTAWFVWDDYGTRCAAAGLKNVILGMDVTHAPFGRQRKPWIYDTVGGQVHGYNGRDAARYAEKYPPPKAK